MTKELSMVPNRLVRFLNKEPRDFTKKDIISFCVENEIQMVNFRYVGGRGRLKMLSFVINDLDHLDSILTYGERVDGSSLFSYVDPASSDLYVIPRYRTAFMNPFADVPTLDLLCSYYDKDGNPLDVGPDSILRKAHRELKERTGLRLEALGELEFYVSSELDKIVPITPQKGYHESHPFAKWQIVRDEAMRAIAEAGGHIKYGHAEVGNIIANDWEYVQHEIEFRPMDVEDAADQLVVAKWIVRKIAYKYGLEVSFAPKIIVGQAGSGLHIHARLMKDDRNAMVDDEGRLNDTAKRMIGGLLKMAPSLTAFGNVVPTSYLRLVPHQEAPTSICWGDRNRSVLVRVPLGWSQGCDRMILDANPAETEAPRSETSRQTVELRSADGSANAHLLLAGMVTAILHGLESDDSLATAERLYVSGNVAKQKDLDLPQLPASCHDAAERLLAQRDLYESYGIFSPRLIDGVVETLRSYDDQNLSERIFGNPDALMKLIKRHIHCG